MKDRNWWRVKRSRLKSFWKIDVLEAVARRCSVERCFRNFCKFHKKTLVLKSLLIKLQAFRPATLLKSDSITSVSLWFLWNFQEQLVCRTSYFVGLHGCFSCSGVILEIDLKKSVKRHCNFSRIVRRWSYFKETWI